MIEELKMAIPIRVQHSRIQSPQLTPNVLTSKKRDWRLWTGIALIASSLVITTNLISHAGARTNALRLSHDVLAGSTLTDADLSLVQVALPTDVTYLQSVASAVGLKATHDLFAGDLLRANATTQTISTVFRALSIPIRAGHLPALHHGSFVDVWVTPSTQGLAIPGPPQLVVSRVAVDSVPDGVDANTDTAITISIPHDDVPRVMTALRDGTIDLAVVPQSDDS